MSIQRMSKWLAAAVLAVTSTLSSAAQLETPWQELSGGWLQTNLNWPGYNTGYDFTVNAPGYIVKLGGLFNGTKKVRLYNAQGQILAQASVTDSNHWGYADIQPVLLQPNQTYTVAIETGWGGSSMYYGMGYPMLPATNGSGHVTIKQSVFGFGTSKPGIALWGQMWGQADVGFQLDDIISIQPVPCDPITTFCVW